ncbi:MAG: hypothetical protein Q9219_005451 [cf. Caloplaca sp. 3 TL-2023]
MLFRSLSNDGPVECDNLNEEQDISTNSLPAGLPLEPLPTRRRGLTIPSIWCLSILGQSHRAGLVSPRNNVLSIGPTPDGGLKAWIQVAVAWLTCLTAWGFANSFGVFQTYYTDTLPESQSTISWIGSVQTWTIFAVSVFAGRALDAGFFFPTFLIGSVVQVIGIFTTSLCKTFWQLVLAQGLCTGIGCGLVYCLAVGIVTTYFEKNRGLAIAVVSTGNSIGGVVYPIVVRFLFPEIGFAWTMRVLGFVNLACLATALALLSPRLPPSKGEAMVEWRVFCDLSYTYVVVGTALVFGGVCFSILYLGSYGHIILGMSYADSTNLILVFNAVGIPVRLLTGWVADRYLGPLNGMIPLCFLSGVFAFAWIGVESRAGHYALMSLNALCAGAFQALFPTAIVCFNKDMTRNGVVLGMAFSVFSFVGLLSPPVDGVLLETNGGGKGGYTSALVASGAASMVGTGFVVGARINKMEPKQHGL